MICRECGTDLPDAAVFCHQCGTPVNEDGDRGGDTARDRFHAATARRQQDDDSPDDEVWQGQYSHLAMFGSWISATAATLVLLVIGILFSAAGGVVWLVVGALIVVLWLGLGLLLLYRQLSIHYFLTEQRIIHEKGLLWRSTDRIELIDVDDVTFKQGPIERLLGIGNVQVTSSDKTHPDFTIQGIANVREVADKIDDLRRMERRRRGLHIESI